MSVSSITLNDSTCLLLMPSPHFSCCYFSRLDLVIQNVIPRAFFSCAGLFYLYWVFVSHMKLSVVLMSFVKNFVGILMGILLDLQIAFGQKAIFFSYQVNTFLS